ncbi:MAG: phosphatase PAP2 family protein [Thiohalocapsa sp.]|uniref:phosphatase PAP2 family protein n=1 Tax=Thiohalocapsa sp. TaxID=2497641 RepID=UPI0025F4FFDD|nr:phosphatase PAP2 family protein [Thiohalocapsa sp.]MCG6941241.1 phosphatase PAP2 family protein [Thiohalocapsa sp.]
MTDDLPTDGTAPRKPTALRRIAAALTEDLRLALVHGAARDDPASTTASQAWLISAALAALALGTALWLLAGYHAGFVRLNAAAALLPGWLWQGLTSLGNEHVAFALSLFVARRHPRVFWTLICAALVAVLYSRGLKPLVDAARPPAVLAPDAFHLFGPALKHESFPSGHSVTAGVFFGVLLLFARRLPWRLLFLVLAVLTGLSRIAVGVHWPVDVAFGLGGGWLAAWIGLRLAARSPWGIYHGAVHLVFVTLGAIVSVSLWFDDGGYTAMALPLKALAVAAVGVTVIDYLLLPLWRGIRAQRRASD